MLHEIYLSIVYFTHGRPTPLVIRHSVSHSVLGQLRAQRRERRFLLRILLCRLPRQRLVLLLVLLAHEPVEGRHLGPVLLRLEDVDAQLKRLSGMASKDAKSLKPELAAWLGQRIGILTQLKAAAEAPAKEEL